MRERPPVLVTRAEPGAARTCETLARLGYRAVNAATARIEPMDARPDWSAASAIIVTSPNGAARLAALGAPPHLPVYAVGEASARAAREAGHGTVITGTGDAAGLLDVILAASPDAPARQGRIIHLRGADQAFDLAGALHALGRPTDSHVVYRARAVDGLSQEASAALGPDAIVLIHSPLGAERLLEQTERAGRLSALAAARVIAISDAAAAPLRRAGAGRITLAARPDEASLLDALAAICPPHA
ncbi:uroporphyrinogen-III synthase [Alkalicaulis satelles]|uniref:Uroporphyrinogen-III synthase n=1 Tax=Alkalicaulis satelles TaxID=2609175 RepID=A0A5M6ZJA6_9PROT|nr:uroporphyrinogen-III synthase [Alkalicaulis satelles]KAA5802311.1 uroporphyrinogen-III synthase [Alkalicaulis satelles]